MRKLSLKSLDFSADELLQKSELKTVFGGYAMMKCCWYGTNNCSACTSCATCNCVGGAVPTYC